MFDISGITPGGTTIKSPTGSSTAEKGVALGSKTLTISDAKGSYGGVIADGGLVNGTGGGITLTSGTQTLTKSNTYTGETKINGGTLALKDDGAITSSSGVNESGNSVFDISGITASGTTIKSLTGSSTAETGVILGNKTLTISAAKGTYSGVIGGAGGITLTGGTQTLAGVNTYKGATTINGGSLIVTAKGSISSSSGVIKTGPGSFTQLSGDTIKPVDPTINGATVVVILNHAQIKSLGNLFNNDIYIANDYNDFEYYSRFVNIGDDAMNYNSDYWNQNSDDLIEFIKVKKKKTIIRIY